MSLDADDLFTELAYGARIAQEVTSGRWCVVSQLLRTGAVEQDTRPQLGGCSRFQEPRPSPVVLPSGVVTLTVDDLELLPSRHPQVKVCIAPMSLVARGLNILVPGGQKSALASVWVCVRPPTQITDSAEMFASVNASALRDGGPSADPVGQWIEQRRRAFSRLFHILTSDPRFSRLSKPLKSEAIAGMLVDMIQLAGRARRGGTPVELYLVDDAFHDEKLGTDLRRLLRYYYDNLSLAEQRALRRIYGSTLESWLVFAGIDGKEAS
ncbi:hypothetical protein [Kibdelosporangium persicum]|nr:hypothetical protein [Kibdelosporangium persicum]